MRSSGAGYRNLREQVDEPHIRPSQKHVSVAGEAFLEVIRHLFEDVVDFFVAIEQKRSLQGEDVGEYVAHTLSAESAGVELSDADLADHDVFVSLDTAGIDLQAHSPVCLCSYVAIDIAESGDPAAALGGDGSHFDRMLLRPKRKAAGTASRCR